jgi:hypothetical protein
VRTAAESGALDVERLANYYKLRREIERLARATDPVARAAANRKLRAVHRAQSATPDQRDQ